MGHVILTNASYDDSKIRIAAPEIIEKCLGIKVYSNPAKYKVDTLTFEHPTIEAIELDHGRFIGHYFHPDNEWYNKKGLYGIPKILDETLNIPYRKFESKTVGNGKQVIYLRTNIDFSQANFIMPPIINDVSTHLYSTWICENNKNKTPEHFACFLRKYCNVYNRDKKTNLFLMEETIPIFRLTSDIEKENDKKMRLIRVNERRLIKN
jgi:hypothetical protein